MLCSSKMIGAAAVSVPGGAVETVKWRAPSVVNEKNTDVDIEAASSGGYDVGWLAAGEWLKYSVNVSAAGNYTAQVRVAAPDLRVSARSGYYGDAEGAGGAADAPIAVTPAGRPKKK